MQVMKLRIVHLFLLSLLEKGRASEEALDNRVPT
jgi:hypothetical protein